MLFFATSSILGQEFRFGILIDPTMTWLRSDVKDITRDKSRLGIDVGMSADYFFADQYALATGISLFNMGGTLRYNNGFTLRTKEENVDIRPGGTVKYKIQYIKIPVAMKLQTLEIGDLIYSANLGIDPMIRVSTRVNYNDEKNVKAIKATKLFNLGWHFGVGAQYSLGENTSLFAGLTFMNTFLDISKRSKERITSNNLSFQIGVLF